MTMTTTRLATLIAGAALFAGPALADDVYLVNGKVYEGVVVERVSSGVRIHLPIGRITVPHDQVLRVVEAPTALQELVERRAALEADPRSTGRQWLELARWAQGHGLGHAAREAALIAAELEPRLEGLQEILGPAGFSFDEERGDWASTSELMARRGYVHSEGRWIPIELHRELERADLERRRHLAETALLEAQRSQIENPNPPQAAAASPTGKEQTIALLPWGHQTVVVVAPFIGRGLASPPVLHHPIHGFGDLVDRAPGSLIGVGRGVPPTGSSGRR
jgi:hypothetical protein